MRCAHESRKLVEGSTGNVGDISSVDIEKIDGCNEVTLGLCATAGASALILLLLLPFFDVAGISWVRSWEGKHNEPITMPQWKQALDPRYPKAEEAFDAMDLDDNGVVDYQGFRDVTMTLKPPLNESQISYAYRGLDENQDGSLTKPEFVDAMTYDHFFAPPLEQPPPVTFPPATSQPLSFNDLLGRMGPASRDSAQDAFSQLDRSGKGLVDINAFTSATGSFNNPLTQDQAKDCFSKLDRDQDQSVEAAEFYQAFEAKNYLPPETSQQLVEMSDYKARLAAASNVVAVMVKTPGLDLGALQGDQMNTAKTIIVQGLANAAGVDAANVQNLEWQGSSVDFAVGGQGEEAQARVVLPPGSDVGATLTKIDKGMYAIADSLDAAKLPGFDKTKLMIFKRSAGNFRSIDHEDGTLGFREFVGASAQFRPPLTVPQARYCFEGLDQDGDQELSHKEFHGEGMTRFFERRPLAPASVPAIWPPTQGIITVQDFVNRMGGLAPDIAFEALDGDHDAKLSLKEMQDDIQEFYPVLTLDQAFYAFHGMNLNRDNIVTKAEFDAVLNGGKFYPNDQATKRRLRSAQIVM